MLAHCLTLHTLLPAQSLEEQQPCANAHRMHLIVLLMPPHPHGGCLQLACGRVIHPVTFVTYADATLLHDAPVGASVGSSVGKTVGDDDGAGVGLLVGLAVGRVVGTVEGLDVGNVDGESVGNGLGAKVGDDVGAFDGNALGELVGAAVGLVVGATEHVPRGSPCCPGPG